MSDYLTTTPQIAVFLRAIAGGCTIEIQDKEGDSRRPIAANTALSILAVGNVLAIARLRIVAAAPGVAAPTVPPCFNTWFCSLPEGRQAVLREDKWMLAHASFDAGAKLAAVPGARGAEGGVA